MIDYVLNSRYIDGSQVNAFLGKNVEEYLEREGTEKYNKYLKSFNYDFFTEYDNQSSDEEATISFGDKKRVVIKRKSFQFPMPFINESHGNQVFMDLLVSEFKPREAQNLEKMYLGGMFGGLPNYEEDL